MIGRASIVTKWASVLNAESSDPDDVENVLSSHYGTHLIPVELICGHDLHFDASRLRGPVYLCARCSSAKTRDLLNGRWGKWFRQLRSANARPLTARQVVDVPLRRAA